MFPSVEEEVLIQPPDCCCHLQPEAQNPPTRLFNPTSESELSILFIVVRCSKKKKRWVNMIKGVSMSEDQRVCMQLWFQSDSWQLSPTETRWLRRLLQFPRCKCFTCSWCQIESPTSSDMSLISGFCLFLIYWWCWWSKHSPWPSAKTKPSDLWLNCEKLHVLAWDLSMWSLCSPWFWGGIISCDFNGVCLHLRLLQEMELDSQGWPILTSHTQHTL